MEQEGYNARTLAEKIGMSYNSVWKVLSGKRPIGSAFRCSFGDAFGMDFAVSFFGPLPRQTKQGATPEFDYPIHHRAHQVVSKAIRDGILLPAASYKCHGCSEQAGDYHHESYAPEDHLCVIPLCKKCHNRHHTGRTRLTFGVVPTAVGVIRIAIASQ